jgi:hypothetical protein
LLRVVSESAALRLSTGPCVYRVQAIAARIRARPSKRFFEKIRARQKFVQQHSGDWTMTGKVPVARVEGEPPLPRTNRKDETHPAHQDHGRIAGR